VVVVDVVVVEAGAAAGSAGAAGAFGSGVDVVVDEVVEVGSVAGLSPPPHATDAITNAAEIKRAMFFMSSSVVTR
jgi:hypothetical protein